MPNTPPDEHVSDRVGPPGPFVSSTFTSGGSRTPHIQSLGDDSSKPAGIPSKASYMPAGELLRARQDIRLPAMVPQRPPSSSLEPNPAAGPTIKS